MLVCVRARARERERGRESLYNCSEWLVIQVGLEWRGRLVMQPKLEMSLCHCGESVCVCYVSVFWLITRISRLYCSTDPLWSAPTHTHRPTLSPFISLPLSPLHLPFFLFAFVFLSFHIYILTVSVYHGHLSHPPILICLCCRYVCLRFAFIFWPRHWNICVYTKLCARVFILEWLSECLWLCEGVRECALGQ